MFIFFYFRYYISQIFVLHDMFERWGIFGEGAERAEENKKEPMGAAEFEHLDNFFHPDKQNLQCQM